MPIAVAGIYEVRLRTVRAGQDLFNVFFYSHTGGLNDKAAECALGFKNGNTISIQNLLSTAVTLEDILVRPIFGTSIEHLLPYTGGEAGLQVGETMPSHIAVSFKYARSSTETNNGWKRFGPMSEGNVAGDFFNAAYVTVMDASALSFQTNLVEAGNTFEPIIFRPVDGSIKDPLPRFQTLTSVNALNRVSSQNSRKLYA